MNTSNSCPKCGAPLPTDAPEALCPACLMSGAIPSDSEATMKLTGANVIAKGAALPSMFPFEFGGYRVLSLLGRGGMGAVYEAEQRESGRRVALKVLGHDLDSEDMRKRFLREGRLAAAVAHPNSIYIFGTEEIEGSPVIVMEIAGGGTLKDELKRRGPLPVKEAVDAMLQIIAGLEAAHAGGVLHRDVKPANCFLAPDGTAKVGDFGLSVSTLARQDSQLTASGMMLGTPSFAPPEQLRGDDLDVRADIYSVGATLHTLLTGKAPFEGTNAVQVVAAVLDKMPAPVTEHRKEVPAALAEVITRCMAKKREMRFVDYAGLRDALLPFSSQVPEPAPLGLRFFAGFIDETLLVLPEIVLGFFISYDLMDKFLVDRTLMSFLPWAGMLMLYGAYYVVCEGIWGAGLGKALCGLRVIGPDRAAPGLRRACVRIACVMLVTETATIFALLTMTGAEYDRRLVSDDGEFLWFALFAGCFLASWVASFLTMRRRNGFAAVHDLVSGTRVVRKAKTTARPRLEISEAKDEAPAKGERIGPFIVIKPLSENLSLAHDPALRRRVWIVRGTGFQPVNEARRDVARPGRLRWLGGTAEWDAFEAPGGQALLAFEKASQPWAVVRWWLADLADEIAAAEKDGTLPKRFDLDQVWINSAGRAVLLDNKERRLETAGTCQAAQLLLDAVTQHALDPKTVPLHSRDVLQKLATGVFDRMSFLAGNLQSLLGKSAVISVRRRAASLLLVPAVLASIFALLWFSIQFDTKGKDDQWRARHPELPPLSAVLRLRAASDPEEGPFFAWRSNWGAHNATGIHIAAHYLDKLGAAVADEPVAEPDKSAAAADLPLDKDERVAIAVIFSKHVLADFYPLISPEFRVLSDPATIKSLSKPLTPEMIASADATLHTELPKFLIEEGRRPWINGFQVLRNILAVIAITQFFSLLIFGVTLGQKVFGFAMVNKKGEIAGRLRMLGRWCIAWIPFILLFARLEVAAFAHKDQGTADIVKCTAYGLVWVLCIIAAILRPAQGFHDEQAKTWLVPR
ncbi:MAG: protein kinase domain-containing protein [Prosthecobacter sp.]|uniref:protein kinase domain-containing protein n=1 Tax=Prosthecobacter sp. TaxID=1965333 RepID=UPI003904619B